jgi:hypothetical protein
MGKLLGLCLVLIACQPMYKEKAEPLKTPKPQSHIDLADKPKYVDDCAVDFAKPAKTVPTQPALAANLVNAGDKSFKEAETTPSGDVLVEKLKATIENYSNALRKDPFNSDATLKLARAYDRALRKGCAIALLKRLELLSENPKYAMDATANIDRVDQNPGWFKDYRKDAMAAVGRP